MQAALTPQQRREAKQEILEQIKQGMSVEQARSASRVPIHRATIYRLLKRAQNNEEGSVLDGRHGHAIKLRGEVLTFLTEHCLVSPDVSSLVLQGAIQKRFSLPVSISQLNRVRASLGLTRKSRTREKKAQKRRSCARIQRRCRWFVAPSRSQRDRIADTIGEGSANGKSSSPSPIGEQVSSGPAKTPPHIAVSGSGRAAPHLGSTRLHWRGSGKAFRAQASLWLSLH